MITHEPGPAVQWLEKTFDALWETYGDIRDVPVCVYGDYEIHAAFVLSGKPCHCNLVRRYACTGWNEGTNRRIPGRLMQLRRDD